MFDCQCHSLYGLPMNAKNEIRIQQENAFLANVTKDAPFAIGREDLGDDDRHDWYWYLYCGKHEIGFRSEAGLYEFARTNGLTIHSY